jgi:Pvc16 N-terminal domain
VSKDALFNVTLALQSRLKAALGGGSVFIGPLDDPNVGTSQLILFLYRIAPNPSLRNRAHRVPSNPVPFPQPAPPPATVYRNSLPLDLHYLVTVGTNAAGSEEAFLKPLGAAMQALQLNPELVGAKLGHEAVHVSLDPLSPEDTSRVWALFPAANYRTSIAYLVSPVWIDPEDPEPVAHPVIQDQLDAGARVALPVE